MKKIYSLALCWLCGCCCWGKTFIAENISQNQLWSKQNSPYIIAADVCILPNAVLTIEAGTTVLFSSQVQLTIEGQLIATGSEKEKIHFAGLQQYNWQGLYFKQSSLESDSIRTDTATNILQHCVFRGRNWNPVHLIHTENRNIRLQHCEITDCQTAIQTEKQSRVLVQNSKISRCYRPLHVRITSQLTFLHSEISDYTLLLFGGSVIFNHNKVENALSRGSHSGLMVWMTGAGVVTIENNQFINAHNAAFTLYKTTKRNTIVLKNNIFKKNKTHLALSCEFARRCKLIVQNNDFYEHGSYPIELFDDCQQQKDTILLDSNYFHKLSLEQLQTKLIKTPDNSSLGQLQTQLRIRGILERRNRPLLKQK